MRIAIVKIANFSVFMESYTLWIEPLVKSDEGEDDRNGPGESEERVHPEQTFDDAIAE